MVIGKICNLVSYYFGYSSTNVPIQVMGHNEDEIKESINNLNKVMCDKCKTEIEEDSNRTDHIRTEEELSNLKTINELEMKKIRGERVLVINLKSQDLRSCIENLNKIEKDEEVKDYPNKLDKEISCIKEGGLSSFFNKIKKYRSEEIQVEKNKIYIEQSENTMKNLSMVFSELKLEEDEELVNMVNKRNASIEINIE